MDEQDKVKRDNGIIHYGSGEAPVAYNQRLVYADSIPISR